MGRHERNGFQSACNSGSTTPNDGRELPALIAFGREPAHFAQGQRDASLFGQARMAAGEDQPQAIIFHGLALIRCERPIRDPIDLFGGVAPRRHARLATQLVNGLEPSR
jgi:hypothetical protein